MENIKLPREINWDVVECPIYDINGKIIKNYKAVHRSDNSRLLGITTQTFCPTTNEQFVEIANQIANNGDYETPMFQEFHQGKILFSYIKKEKKQTFGNFEHESFIILSTGHTGNASFRVQYGCIMVRCSNQLAKFFAKTNHDVKRLVNVLHRKNHSEKLKQINFANFSKIDQHYKAIADELITKPITRKEKHIFVDKLLESVNILPKPKTDRPNNYEKYRELLDNCINTETADMGRNQFALLNGITRFTTHHMKKREPVFLNAHGRAQEFTNNAFKLLNF